MDGLGKVEKDVAGFETISFWDSLGKLVGLQATERVVLFSRMGINSDQVRALITTLQRWLDTGSFKVKEQVEVVVEIDEIDPLSSLIRAIHTCEASAVLILPDVATCVVGQKINETLHPPRNITFRAADPATLPVGECVCGARRVAEDGRCGDGCDDD